MPVRLVAFAVALVAFAALSAHSLPLEQYVLTPAGYQHSSCVHEVPSGSQVIREDDHLQLIHPDGTLRRVEACQFPTLRSLKAHFESAHGDQAVGLDGEGWQAYTKQNAGNVSSFIGNFNIPAVPSTYSGQTLFFFTGMQNIDWVPPQPRPSDSFDIIQPVAQYGPSSAGGGNFWSMASWYVTLGLGTVFSKLVQIKAGDVIYGEMTRVGPESWKIISLDVTTGVSSDITVKKSLLATQPWIYNTLEVYGVTNCDQFPPTGQNVIHFTNLTIAVGGTPTPISWEIGLAGQQPPVCNATAVIYSSDRVDIVF